MPQAVFFDLDGTLYDKKGLARRLILEALRRGRLSAGGPWRPLACLRMLALERKARRALAAAARSGAAGSEVSGYDALFGEIARRSGLSRERVRAWYDQWYMPAMVGQLEKHYGPRRDVVAMAERYRAKGVKIAVLSDYGCVREKLEALRIHPEMFDALLDAPSLGGFKPSPAVFLGACKSVDADPTQCVMVGDRPDTDGGCTAIGMEFIRI